MKQNVSPLGGKKGPHGRFAPVAKAGKRRAPYQAPPRPSRRNEIIKNTQAWIDANTVKARTNDIKESVPSTVEGYPEIRLEFIPGFPRWELMRALRQTTHTAKGNRTDG